MKRILVTARWPVGGIRTFIKYVYTQMSCDNLAIELAVPDVAEARQLEADLIATGIRVTWTPNSTVGYFRALRKRLRGESVDMLHTHGFTALLAGIAAASRTPHLVTIHDVLLDAQLSGPKGLARRLALKFALNRVTAIHAVSEACRDNVVGMLDLSVGDASRIEVIRNGIEIRPFLDAPTEDIRERLNIREDSLLVGFFGRFMNQKGFRYLIEAVEQVRRDEGRPIVVLCVGSGGFRARESRDIHTRALSEAFHFVDFVPDVGPLMKSVDVVAMPSLWEACGLVAMEAMVSGAPLLASDIPALRELCKGSPALLIAPAKASALASALSDFNRDSARAASRDYAETAATRFSVERSGSALRQLYDRMLNSVSAEAIR
ncbi:MAG: glycosyltransferase family 4 protein [Pseudomonadota bacterium]